ncbi:MAG: tetratricopeptide repeat protein [Beijerinckiaceae bacterium]
MQTFDRQHLIACCAVAAALAGGSAHAFEAREDARETAPRSALPAFPTPSLPSLPGGQGLGVDEGMRKILRGFRLSYDSGDKSSALRQLEAAADQGNIAARWKAARMLADGDGVARDDYRAFRHFVQIVRTHGDETRESPHAGVVARSLVALGIYWRDGIKGSPVRANKDESLRLFTHAATLFGDAEAQYQLGVMWVDGSAGAPDSLRAARWLNLAAEKGHPTAQAVLGRMLFLGEAMPRQQWRGLMWLQLARQNAKGESTGWVRELHDKAFEAASEDERRMARQHAERLTRATERRY